MQGECCPDALDRSRVCLGVQYAERLERRWTADQRQIVRQQRLIQRLQQQLAEQRVGEPLSVPR